MKRMLPFTVLGLALLLAGCDLVKDFTSALQAKADMQQLQAKVLEMEEKFNIVTEAYNQLMGEEIMVMRNYLADMEKKQALMQADYRQLKGSVEKMERMLGDYKKMYQ